MDDLLLMIDQSPLSKQPVHLMVLCKPIQGGLHIPHPPGNASHRSSVEAALPYTALTALN